MKQFNYPTTIYFGEGALAAGAEQIARFGIKKPLLVTDETLAQIGLVETVVTELKGAGVAPVVFDRVHPNPTDEDVEQGTRCYRENGCDGLVALGGGSPMDAAKVIGIMAQHSDPLSQYDDAKGGDQKIEGQKLPRIIAIPTTAGTGSEAGRCGVIIMRDTGVKTIFFHPRLMPSLAILDPELTRDLPPGITAATGIDAFTHCLEAYFAPGFDPMADGVALEGMNLVVEYLPLAVKNGDDLDVRAKMLIAATMGATAFQKGLGMIHSLAHPLSSECGLHHGLANALMLPAAVGFIEGAELTAEQRTRLKKTVAIFDARWLPGEDLSSVCRSFFESLGIHFGLHHHGVEQGQLASLAGKAFADVCHQTNMIPVTEADLLAVYRSAF